MDTGLERRLTARTLEDLGELTAPWLEGRITFLPTYTLDTPAAETEGLIAHLAAFNRAGYTTTESQPAVPFDGHDGQRAFVSGFASEATVDAVEAAILGTRLIALVTPTGRDNPFHIPVTVMEDAPCSFIGPPFPATTSSPTTPLLPPGRPRAPRGAAARSVRPGVGRRPPALGHAGPGVEALMG